MTVGELLKKTRLDAGMTQKELAEKCGMADSAIRKYESGKVVPKIGTLQKLADALGVSLSELYPREFIFNSKTQTFEPILAKEKAPQSDVDRLMEGLNAESIRKLREYAELLLLGQGAQSTPGSADDKEPAEK